MRTDKHSTIRRMYRVLAVLAAAGLAFVWAGCADKRAPERDDERAEAKKIGAQTDQKNRKKAAPETPKRIIVMIGDGMGASAITGAQYAADQRLNMRTMDRLNFITTHSHEYVTTDSAASATAFATGQKTHYQGVSVEPGTTKQQQKDEKYHLETALEAAEGRGWKTGLVATSRIVHATPAAFAAHRANRNSDEAIAADIADSGVDVLLGGGRKYFDDRSDGENLLAGMKKDGYRFADSSAKLQEAFGVAEQLVGLYHRDDPPAITSKEGRSVSLPELTRGAIEVLDRNNDDGFFLMVEGSQIDWRGHEMAGVGTIKETLEFDRAVGVALEYARDRRDTLVMTVADHETGGLSLLDPEAVTDYETALGGKQAAAERVDYPNSEADQSAPSPTPRMPAGDATMVPVYGHLSMASRGFAEDPGQFWAIHTPEMVPMFTEGNGADYLVEAGDNAEAGSRLKELIAGERASGAERREEKPPSSREKPPRNVVLFVGDGVGLDALTSTHYGAGELGMREMPVRGLASVRGGDRLVPDDGSAATALATATRGNDGDLGVVTGKNGEREQLESVLEKAEARGYQTGLVTTGELTNPTLAAMYAHRSDGASPEEIAGDFVGLSRRVEKADGVDLAFGGGRGSFGAEGIERLEQRGVQVQETWADAIDSDRPTVRLMTDGPFPIVGERRGDGEAAELPTLGEMTQTALEELSGGEEPFFLVVEADGPGRLQGSLDKTQALVEETAEFDAAVERGLAFRRDHGETLVVATADADQTLSMFDNHYGFAAGVCGVAARCGGEMTLHGLSVAIDEIPRADGFDDAALQGEYSPLRFFFEYAWPLQAARAEADVEATNSANAVPVFAAGPWAERLEGGIAQPEIGALLVDWAESGTTQ